MAITGNKTGDGLRPLPDMQAASMDVVPGLRVRIHRGARQIGGTCVELECQGKHLLLDIGAPLDAGDPATVDMPDVPGVSAEDPSLLGILISHPHQDHYGLASRVPRSTTFLMGAATEKILAAAADFTPSGVVFDNVIHLENRKPVVLGPFVITPYLVDHSAYDAYAVLIEAGGKRLFYSGDLRGHGRKAKLFESLLADPPANVDAFLMEGTTITRAGTGEGFATESDLENEMVALFKATPGMPLVWCSGQNIDRLVTVFRAAKRSNRQFIMDMYTAHILAATGNPHLPQADWPETRVFLPRSQRQRILQDKSFDIANRYKAGRIYPEQLAGAASTSVMLFRPSMRVDLENANCLAGACLVYSMWDGYLKDPKMKTFLSWLDDSRIPLHQCHTSGHASVKDLQRLRPAFGDAPVVPIHTQQPDLYEAMFGNVQQHEDGEWWEVAK
jgi:ribonuclease J